MTSHKPTRQKFAKAAISLLLAGVLCSSLASDIPDKLSSDEATKAKATLELLNGKLAKSSKSKAKIELIDSDDSRIHISDDIKGQISITFGLILRFIDDKDAIVSLIAQQQALLKNTSDSRHDTKKSPTASRLLGLVGSAINNAVDSKTGISGAGQAISDGGSELANGLISRAQEKDMDESTISWMIESGFNPYGALRAQKVMLALVDSGQTQSQNNPKERLAYLEALIEDNSKSKSFSLNDKTVFLNRTKTPSTVSLPTSSAESNGELDEPVLGVSLSRYAAIKNDIAFKGEPDGLAKHNISAADFTKIDQQWTSRISQDKRLNLSSRYTVHYLEASQGEFADWGRDVAQVKQTGRLQLGTDPIAIDDWLTLRKANSDAAHGDSAATSAFTKAVKEKGLSAYDFYIVDAWWLQRAKDKSSQGDMSLLQRMN